MAVIPLMVART